jgi:hypothetical protein
MTYASMVRYPCATTPPAVLRGLGRLLVVPRQVATARDTRPSGRAKDDVSEAMFRRDSRGGNAPYRPDQLRDCARGSGTPEVCGVATRRGRPPLSSISSLLWLVSLRL